MNICLYGASSPEIDPVYLDAAYAFGRLLAQHGHTLIASPSLHHEQQVKVIPA